VCRKIVTELVAIAVLAGAAGSAPAADHRAGKSANKPAAAAAPRGNPKAAARGPAPLANNPDFIDSGVLEGEDTLENGLEIGGLLVDDTVTKFGHELFDAFNRAWKPPEGASYNIAFTELFDPRRGSFITVKLNDTVVFEGFLTPREEAINDLGKALAKDIRNIVRNTQNLEEEEFY
jgi:hypothetical protein